MEKSGFSFWLFDFQEALRNTTFASRPTFHAAGQLRTVKYLGRSPANPPQVYRNRELA